ncbi:MAG TPA: hypothetical protein VH370_04030 [Humisphaera sp.]|jgi:hypothetical protein|nr:hypothetical protein [Humisphaera sp.]
MRTFKHSGDLGDIIFALPAMRALGGGILYLDPAGGESEPLVRLCLPTEGRTKLTAATIESVRPLLLLQEYVADVRVWSGEKVDINLDQFRAHISAPNLADSHLRAFGLPTSHRDSAWLRVDVPLPQAGFPIVINRTVRFACNHEFWEDFLPTYYREALFVGFPKEHEFFEFTFGFPIRYMPTPTILDLARVIAGGEEFAGNPSLAHAIAEGMKKNKTLEVYRLLPNVVFPRPGARYV